MPHQPADDPLDENKTTPGDELLSGVTFDRFVCTGCGISARE
jgi:hypothetical protein